MHDIDRRSVDTIRFLATDAVERAGSGHPGMPLGAAPMAYVLWKRFLRHDPADPAWFNRDRFILSAGHGSALLYALLHVFGYEVSLDDLRAFRQWGSKTAGHPEHGLTPGVEATTGPLGQGFAMGVGMAIAEAHLASMADGAAGRVVDHHTYAIVSDGDLMEGVASEAASLAGTLGLGKIVYLYDDNHITIEGSTDLAFTEDVGARFAAYGWHVSTVDDGNDLGAIETAIDAARAETDRPSLVRVRTHIGFGSPKQDSASAHGEPLGPDAIAETKRALGWPLEPAFRVPDDVRQACDARPAGSKARGEWCSKLAAFEAEHPEAAGVLGDAIGNRLPGGWDERLPVFETGGKPVATRSASGKVIEALSAGLPALIGGSADLAPSNKTLVPGVEDFTRDRRGGRNLRFGIREHAMGAVANGIALHGGLRPFTATFLVFSDYMRPALRLAALMQTGVVFAFTHDSIGVGEDGPTHQPVENLESLRAIPGLAVVRPADANETVAAWRDAIESGRPCVLALSRQALPVLDVPRGAAADGVVRGAYVVRREGAGSPAVTLVATGSEVHAALGAADLLEADGVGTRVISMPCRERFLALPEAARSDVIPPGSPVVSVEAGVALGWYRITGGCGETVSIERFGASAPGPVVMEKFGFSAKNVAEVARGVARSSAAQKA